MNNTLRGRRALVTGAASGIGCACAERVADAGADVVVLDSDSAGAASVADATGGRALICDLTADDALHHIGDESLDMVVNNAGFQHVAPIESFERDVCRRVLRVMLEVPFEPIKRLLEPAEVAHLAVFLCGDGAASITGASYDMAGGWTAT